MLKEEYRSVNIPPTGIGGYRSRQYSDYAFEKSVEPGPLSINADGTPSKGSSRPRAEVAPAYLAEALGVSNWKTGRQPPHSSPPAALPADDPKYRIPGYDADYPGNKSERYFGSVESHVSSAITSVFEHNNTSPHFGSYKGVRSGLAPYGFDGFTYPSSACGRFSSIVDSEVPDSSMKRDLSSGSDIQSIGSESSFSKDAYSSPSNRISLCDLMPDCPNGSQFSLDRSLMTEEMHDRSLVETKTVIASPLRREQFSTVMELLNSYGNITEFEFGSKSITVSFSDVEEAKNALELDAMPVCNYVINVKPVGTHGSYTGRSHSRSKRSVLSSSYHSNDVSSISQHNSHNTYCDNSDTSSSLTPSDTTAKNKNRYNLYKKTDPDVTKCPRIDANTADPLLHKNSWAPGKCELSLADVAVKPAGALIVIINWILSLC